MPAPTPAPPAAPRGTPPPPSPQGTAPAAGAAPAQPPKRILLVDDEAQIRAFLKTLLLRRFPARTRIDECGSAEEALAILQNASYDLLITDYKMDRLSGIDLLEKVRTNYPQMARILMTAYHDAEIAIQAVERGAVDGFMNKPFDTKNLVTLVESLLEAPRIPVPPTPALPPPAAPALAKPVAPQAPAPARSAPARAPPPRPAPALAPTAGPPSTRAPAPASAPRAPPPPPAPASPGGITLQQAREEITRIEHALRHLRVQFGLGRLSAEGYRQANEGLRRERARLEVWLLKQTEGTA